jgi:NADH:ubiquinone oxidoreductase subunit F (NADH-binding)
MQACATCRNGTDELFSITKATRTGNYDSSECAILGHAVRHEPLAYCCEHCAECD